MSESLTKSLEDHPTSLEAVVACGNIIREGVEEGVIDLDNEEHGQSLAQGILTSAALIADLPEDVRSGLLENAKCVALINANEILCDYVREAETLGVTLTPRDILGCIIAIGLRLTA